MNRVTFLLLCFLCTQALAQTATISGTVTEAGTGNPVPDVTVAIADTTLYTGPGLDFAFTDSAGNYTLTVTVDPSGIATPREDTTPAVVVNEVLLEIVSETHEPARAGDTTGLVDCFLFCELDDSNDPEFVGAIPVTAGATITQNFSVAPGASFSGNVTASAGGPLADVPVQIFTDEPFERLRALGTTFTDGAGNYTFDYALKAGTYFAGAGVDQFITEPLPYGNFVSQAYSGFTCEYLSCVITATTPITVSTGVPVTAIDFVMEPGALMTGQILDAATGLPISDPEFTFIRIWTPDDGLQLATFAVFSDAFGPTFDSSYRIEGLSGSYILEIDPQPSTTTDLLRILNDTSSCPFAGCDRGEGVPVTLLPGSPVVQNFSLNRGGKITGQVTDAATGAPINGSNAIAIAILTTSGEVAGGGVIDAAGTISTADGVEPGTYIVTTGLPFRSQSITGQGAASFLGGNFADQAFSGIDCAGLACDLGLATPVTLTAGAVTPNIDFALNQGFTLSGTVTDATSGTPLRNRNVEIFTPAGQRVALENTDSTGTYTTGGLPNGDYRVVVKDGGRVTLGAFGFNGLGFFGQVFGNPSNCMQDFCDPTSGSNVTIAGADVSGIDFALNPGPTISGQIIDTATGLPVRLTVDVFDASGNNVGAWSTVSSGRGQYVTSALFAGSYTLVPRLTRSFSISGPTSVPKNSRLVKGGGSDGSLTVQITDSDVEGVQLEVVQSLIFAGGFESR
ncbi:MAG: carboxypeptidase regulatory-like domain-containing protein [Pseudomonadota bacterium]